jgi:hypothetical protein
MVARERDPRIVAEDIGVCHGTHIATLTTNSSTNIIHCSAATQGHITDIYIKKHINSKCSFTGAVPPLLTLEVTLSVIG